MTRIAIVGSGLIGRAWAAVFAAHGFDVAVHDSAPETRDAALAGIAANIGALAAHGLVPDAQAASGRIRIAAGLADAVADADLVQESGPETLEAKKELFAAMDRAAPADAILASSTSYIAASTFTEHLDGRARCLVAHPVNPPHLVPIVELAPAPWTDPEAVARARDLYTRAGQVPIVLRKEIGGFVLNRLQAALLAEAFRLVDEGIASPEDIDKTVRDGLGLRWSFMGPFETIELNAPGGIPDYCARYAASLARMTVPDGGRSPFAPSTVAKIMAEWEGAQTPERIAELTRWRDARLAALVAMKRQAAPKPG